MRSLLLVLILATVFGLVAWLGFGAKGGESSGASEVGSGVTRSREDRAILEPAQALEEESTSRSLLERNTPQESVTGRTAPPRVEPILMDLGSSKSDIELVGRVVGKELSGAQGTPLARTELSLAVVPSEPDTKSWTPAKVVSIHILTDDQGRFRCRLSRSHSKEALYTVHVHRLREQDGRLFADAAGTFPQQVRLRPGENELGLAQVVVSDPLLAGRCVNAAGVPIAGVRVTAQGVGNVPEVETDELGRFELRSRIFAETTLKAVGAPIPEAGCSMPARCGDRDVLFVVPTLGSVSGSLEAFDENSVVAWKHCLKRLVVQSDREGFEEFFSVLSDEEVALLTPKRFAETNSVGQFRFEAVQPGRYLYVIVPPHGIGSIVDRIDVVTDVENAPAALQRIDVASRFEPRRLELVTEAGLPVRGAQLTATISAGLEESTEFDGSLEEFLVPHNFEGKLELWASGCRTTVFEGWPSEERIVLESAD